MTNSFEAGALGAKGITAQGAEARDPNVLNDYRMGRIPNHGSVHKTTEGHGFSVEDVLKKAGQLGHPEWDMRSMPPDVQAPTHMTPREWGKEDVSKRSPSADPQRPDICDPAACPVPKAPEWMKGKVDESLLSPPVPPGLIKGKVDESLLSPPVPPGLIKGKVDESLLSPPVPPGLIKGNVDESLLSPPAPPGLMKGKVNESLLSPPIPAGLMKGKVDEKLPSEPIPPELMNGKVDATKRPPGADPLPPDICDPGPCKTPEVPKRGDPYNPDLTSPPKRSPSAEPLPGKPGRDPASPMPPEWMHGKASTAIGDPRSPKPSPRQMPNLRLPKPPDMPHCDPGPCLPKEPPPEVPQCDPGACHPKEPPESSPRPFPLPPLWPHGKGSTEQDPRTPKPPDFTEPDPRTLKSPDFTEPDPRTPKSPDFTEPDPKTPKPPDFTEPDPKTPKPPEFPHCDPGPCPPSSDMPGISGTNGKGVSHDDSKGGPDNNPEAISSVRNPDIASKTDSWAPSEDDRVNGIADQLKERGKLEMGSPEEKALFDELNGAFWKSGEKGVQSVIDKINNQMGGDFRLSLRKDDFASWLEQQESKQSGNPPPAFVSWVEMQDRGGDQRGSVLFVRPEAEMPPGVWIPR